MTFSTVQPWQSAKWRCVLIGSERLLIECAIRLQDQGHEVIAIVSDQPAIVEWAYKARIMTLDHAASLIDAHLPAFDYLFSITNLRVLGPDVLMLPRRAAINFHDGPLPAYAGLNVPVWAILNGETHHGISWHLMTVDVDAGDILLARSFDLHRDDSALSINTKCFVAALDSFDMLIVGLATGSIIPQPQDDVQGRFYGLGDRLPCGGAIDWNSPALTIADYVRALDHGHYANPVGAIKASVDGQVFLIGTATAQSGKSDHPTGTIVSTSSDGLRVATSTADIVISRLSTCSGVAIMKDDQFVRHGFLPGARMDHLSVQQQDTLTAMTNAVGRFEPWWRDRLARRHPLLLPNIDYAATRLHDTIVHSDQAGLRSDETKGHERFVLAALVAYLGRIADKQRFDLGYSDPILASPCIGVEAWFASQLPMGIAIDFGRNLSYLREAIGAEIRQLRRKIGHMADLFARSPELRRDDGQDPATLPVAIIIVDDLDDGVLRTDADLTIAMRSDGDACRWFHDPCRLDPQAIGRMQAGFLTLLDAARRNPAMAIGALPIITTDEQDKIIAGWNATHATVREDICLHQLFVEQAQRTPNDPAVTCHGETLTYAEVDRRSNQLARHLRSLGVGPDMLIGLNVERSVNLLVAMIAIHKAGGAYVPLDPTYPSDRVAYMIKDARAAIIITDHALLSALAPTDATILCLDSDWPAIAKLSSAPVLSTVQSENLAYVIYTSGSTGKPKGVMVEHRNAVNFFAGMDCEIEAPGTWLAVTSLSFDISVLELYWTLTRGFHVVLATSNALKGGPARVNAPRPPMGFSLFYFPTAHSCSAADQYRLLIEGAKFADTHDFDAVWTPERHFHAFGGLYPNPSVASAAIATITSRVKIRGGSVVLPLHHPIRIAEEWSLVDNLSHGRVGISFAAGWQPNDFVLRPDSFADRNKVMMKGVETVRALWRGETCAFPGPLGTLVDTAIFPRPVQPELPVWITSAGNADTFAAAGTAGTFLLTHLLGQTVDELTAKIGRYRAAWAAAGHVGDGHVTLMLHSFVGEDARAVRDAVRAPMIAYLRSSTDLVKQFAWSFPAFKRRPGMEDSSAQTDLSSITDAEMDALLDHAFDRYYATSGLFGTPQDCLEMVDRVRKAGVDEIGCLIDFGLPVQQALDHLPSLDALRQLANAPLEGDGDTVPALMERHHVTHLQCTPSMAHMLVADDDARIQLKKLKRLMVGGEAFPPALAQELLKLVDGAVMNMYGPTETTIWSSVHILDGMRGAVPLGKPLANQQIFILDSRQQLLPPGIPGELVIAGDGVVRGYLHRPELTAERFIPHPFRNGERAYRTGDLACQRPDGTLDFLGRLDNQVKIRGYRIELGEVEAVLSSHPAVEQAIVSAREDTPGDVRLVGYYVPADVSCPPRDVLRDFMRVHLPEFMVPQLLVETSALPRTPNGKVDRNALPAPQEAEGRAVTMLHVAPDDAMERKVAAIWCDVLKLDSVGTRDNFFDIGGHSLLAVQVHRHLRAALDMPLALTDIFRFPTIHALSAHLSDGNRDEGALLEVQARGAERRAAYNRRRSLKSAMTAQD